VFDSRQDPGVTRVLTFVSFVPGSIEPGILSKGQVMSNLNVGNIDRGIRVVVGLVLIALAATHVIGAWGYVGIIPLVTGVVAYCPLYRLLGVRTCSR
jgi:hypothetical protein